MVQVVENRTLIRGRIESVKEKTEPGPAAHQVRVKITSTTERPGYRNLLGNAGGRTLELVVPREIFKTGLKPGATVEGEVSLAEPGVAFAHSLAAKPA